MLEDRATAREHVKQLIEWVVQPAVHPQAIPLEVAAHSVGGEPIPPAEAYARTFEPIEVGARWGRAWDTTWFRFRATVPAEWAGSEVVARIGLGGRFVPGFSAEGILWDGDRVVKGLHHEQQDVAVVEQALGGEAVELLVEAAANPTAPLHSAEWPLLQAEYVDGAPLYTLRQAELAVVDREMEALWFDLRAVLDLYDVVTVEPRKSQVWQVLVEAATAVDRRDVRSSVKAARAVLARALGKPSTIEHEVTAVGHAHIDSAWLWPVRETKRKCARTFATQLDLLDRYPEHRFVCSQAVQYQWMKDGYPDVFERIKAAVAEGRWEPVGGMWVEPDTNVPSGESLVRQVVMGARFFAEELGHESDELWIPDVFGYSAALPQIAVEAGMRALITQKLSWNAINTFPHHTFHWEGIDGNRILTHFPPSNSYNGRFTPGELHRAMERYKEHGVADRSLYLYGFGDGGGGPNRDMLELGRRVCDVDGLPRADIGTVDGFLDGIEADGDALSVWVGELYFELHRGTYTTQAELKRLNRRCEEALREVELWWTAVCCSGGAVDWSDYPGEQLDGMWKDVLLNQFHDIIPGSSINWVNVDARNDYTRVLTAAESLVAAAQARLVGPPASAPSRSESLGRETASRSEPVAEAVTGSLRPGETQPERSDTDTRLVAFNPARTGRYEVVELPGDGGLAMVSAPPMGWAEVGAGPDGWSPYPAAPVVAGDGFMENEHLRVEWDGDGLLTSVFDKTAQREALAGRGNLFQLHEDNPANYDAWDVDLTYYDNVADLVDAESVELVTSDPLRAELRVVRRFGASTIDQLVRLAAGSRRVDFVTTVDWRESHRFLKVAFPVDVRSARATYEIQHGWIERPTVWNTSWDLARFEVCAQRWADLSETGYGVALLNESKYGYDVKGNIMRLSLLRAPGWPDPQADRGTHRFTYSLLPHAGDPMVAGVAEEAERLNLPLDIRPGSGAGTVVGLDRPGVSIEAVKKADRRDSLVVRLCEVSGGRGSVRMNVPDGFTRAVRCDLLERERAGTELPIDGGTVTVDLRPFQLVTLELTP